MGAGIAAQLLRLNRMHACGFGAVLDLSQTEYRKHLQGNK
jgi:hypothetical protein